jgi:hypothetical protein
MMPLLILRPSSSWLDAHAYGGDAARERRLGMAQVFDGLDRSRQSPHVAIRDVRVDFVRVRAGPVKHDPDRPDGRDLDDLVLPNVALELEVHGLAGTVDEVDALTGRRVEHSRFDTIRRHDDDDLSGACRRGQ